MLTREQMLDRFGDEFEAEEPYEPTCMDCNHFFPCDIEGHKSVGWCDLWSEFHMQGDPDCTEE